MLVFEAKALLFDMDGTLIDSSRSVLLAWQAWCAETGADLDEVLRICQGTPCRQTIRAVAPHLDLAREVARYEALEHGFDGGQQAFAGAESILAGLPQGSWALVTSAAEIIARHRFSRCGLPFPRAAVTSESVRDGKPAPDPFLAGARQLGVAPEECIVFEDSHAGVEAALAAGCRVIVVGDAVSQRAGVLTRIKDYAGMQVVHEPGRGVRVTIPA